MTRRSLLVAPVLVVALTVGCKNSGDSGKQTETTAAGKASYTVRGKVTFVQKQPASVEIHHETIPDFVNSQGKKVGMMAMTMPFGLADDKLLDVLTVGAPVEFTFSVDFSVKPPLQITSAKKLPADTALEL